MTAPRPRVFDETETERLTDELLKLANAAEAKLSDAAIWLIRAGYPFDFHIDEPPPEEFRQALIDAAYADPDGTIHGGELTRDEVAQMIAEEAGWLTHDKEKKQ